MAIGYKTGGEDGESGSFYEPGMGGGLESVKEETPSAPVSQNRVAGERMTYQTATGEITVQRAEKATFTAPEQQGAKVMSAAGFPTTLAEATKDAVVDLPNFGTTSIAAALTMGLVRSRAGGGYELVGDVQETAPPADEKKPDAPNPNAPSDDVSLEGVDSIPPSIDIVHGQLREAAGPATYQALISGAVLGADLTAPITDLARSSGQPVEHVREAVEGVLGEYRRAAEQVARANGVRNLDAMLAFHSENNPDKIIDAFQELVEHNNAGPLAKASKQYSRLGRMDYANAEILGADLGKGVRAFERDGAAWLSINGEEMTFQKAVAHGKVNLSGGGR